MPFRDLREFIDVAKKLGELKEIRGAHWNLEIGCLSELMAEQVGPMLLFEDIPDYPTGFRVLTNFLSTPKRFAMAAGLSIDATRLELLRMWKDKLKSLRLIPPHYVDDGPILENVLDGERVNVGLFPAPRWHEHDGGRYVGTADMVIVKDPDSSWINMGTYRACIQGRDRLSLWMIADRDGRRIASKYWAAGKGCPVAIVFGHEPGTWMAAPMKLKPGVSEYDFAGGIRGEAVEVLRGGTTGLPVPAHAEIVFEGEILPPEQESVAEGPFGEWPGYYAHEGLEPVVRIERIMHRHDPILLGFPPLLPTTMDSGIPTSAARLWEHLENCGIPNIRGVWSHCRYLLVVISIAQSYPGHSAQTLLAASGLQYGPGMDAYYVVVDEDIDPSDLKQVLWAMCTRVDPRTQVQIVTSCTSGLDPRLSPESKSRGELTMGRMLIDACVPYTWKDKFPRPNRFGEEIRREVLKKWSRDLA
jgi:UbiD family decarboxylase